MKRPRAVACALSLLAGSVLIAFGLSTWRFVAAEWHLRRLASEDRETREAAALALGSLASLRATPLLLEAAATESIAVETAARALAGIGRPALPALREALADGRRPLRSAAVKGLLAIEPGSLGAAARLLEELTGTERDVQGIWGLARLESVPDEAIQALIGTLRDPTYEYRWMAAGSLGEMGPRARASLPALLEILRDERSPLEGHEALALVEIAPEAPEVISALLGALESPGWPSRSAEVRERVIEALEKLGPAARDALPRLATEAERGDGRTSYKAVRALDAIARGDACAIPALARALASVDASAANQASQVLPAYGPGAVAPVIAVVERANDTSRWQAIRALGNMGSRARPAVPLLVRVLAEDLACQAVIRALQGIGPAAVSAVPALIAEIERDYPDDQDTRHWAAEALGRIGPDAVPALTRLVGREDIELRQRACNALAYLGRAAGDAAPELAEALLSEKKWLRLSAATGLEEIGPPAREALPALLACLDDSDPDVAAAAASAILSVNPAAVTNPQGLLSRLQQATWRRPTGSPSVLDRFPELRPRGSELVRLFAEGSPTPMAFHVLDHGISDEEAAALLPVLVRRAVDQEDSDTWSDFQALAQLGPRARGAVPLLLEHIAECRTNDWSPGSEELIDCLGRIGEPREKVLPVLEEAATAERLDVAMAAAWWLWKAGAIDDQRLARLLGKVLKVLVSRVSINDGCYFPHVRHEAVAKLKEMGPRAASAQPALLRALGDPEPELRALAGLALWKVAGEVQLERAVTAIIGAAGDRRQHEFDQWFDSEGAAPVAVSRSLGEIGPPALPFILSRLGDEDERVRLALVAAVGAMGPAAGAARPALVARLEDEDFRVRAEAARALEKLEVTAAELPRLLELAGHADRNVVDCAADAIASLASGPLLDAAVQRLAELLDARESPARLGAARALGRLGPRAAASIPSLGRGLTGEGSDGVAAVEALAAMGAAGKPFIEKALTAAAARSRLHAARALWRLERRAEPLVPVLSELLDDADAEVREGAARGLGAMGPAAGAAMPRLVAVASVADPAVRAACLRAAATACAPGPNAVSFLVPLLTDGDADVRQSAARALARLGPGARDAVPQLIEALKDGHPGMRAQAARALSRVGAGQEACAGLCAALKDPRGAVRAAAADALGELDLDVSGILPDLIAALGEPNHGGVGVGVRKALARLGGKAVAPLVAALESNDVELQGEALEALGEIGPAAKDAIPKIQPFLEEQPYLQAAAQRALSKIAGAALER